jgi:two-component system, chemotaxis family, sensor kinase CheA
MDELLTEFLKEAPELVQQAAGDLIALENDPGNAPRIDSAFRAIHTLKGSVALFDFAPMGSMLHTAEDLLGAIRAGKVKLSRSSANALISCVDACDRWVAQIGQSGQLPAEAGTEAARIAAELRGEQQAGSSSTDGASLLPGDEAAHVDGARDAVTRTLRVDVERIDELVDILGDLIVAKNELAHLAKRAAGLDSRFARDLANNQSELGRLIGTMQRAVMQVRMVPLSRTFQRFPRLVRDISSKLGKAVAFKITGDDIEADRSIVDGLFDPLLHVLRNAAGHGIEDAQTRARLGKPAIGEIALQASRDGDYIVVAIEDDGRGIDPAKLREHAKSRRPGDDAAVDALSDEAAMALVFAPGISTAGAVSDISGRGVGMDAARTAVEALGGRIELKSSIAAGTVVSLRFPQVAVITTVVLVKLGAEQFGIPIDALQETARVPQRNIQSIKSGSAFVLRDRTIPLLNLAQLLKVPQPPRGSADAKIVIAKTGDHAVGVEVEAFGERIDVMLRPPTGMLAGVRGVLGSALLGDGSVLLILDLPELIG